MPWATGEGGWFFFPFFDCSSPFCFLLNEFHCTFCISYKMLPCYVLLLYFDEVVIGCRDFFLSCLLCFFPYSRLSSYLLRLFLYLISFLLFPCASVWENTRAWVTHFLYLLFSRNEIIKIVEESPIKNELLVLSLKWRCKYLHIFYIPWRSILNYLTNLTIQLEFIHYPLGCINIIKPTQNMEMQGDLPTLGF